MPLSYAQAIWKSVEKGADPHAVVASVHKKVLEEGRGDIMPKILNAFKRLAERESARNRTQVFVAREKDGKQAFIESRVAEADIVIDETLIGGWRLEDKERLVDASYKSMLLKMYNQVTA